MDHNITGRNNTPSQAMRPLQKSYPEIGEALLDLFEPAEWLRAASKALAFDPELSERLNHKADELIAKVQHLGCLLERVEA